MPLPVVVEKQLVLYVSYKCVNCPQVNYAQIVLDIDVINDAVISKEFVWAQYEKILDSFDRGGWDPDHPLCPDCNT